MRCILLGIKYKNSETNRHITQRKTNEGEKKLILVQLKAKKFKRFCLHSCNFYHVIKIFNENSVIIFIHDFPPFFYS